MADIVTNNSLDESFIKKFQVVDKPKLSTRVYSSGSYTYVGKTSIGLSNYTTESIWQIKRIYSLGSDTLISWADGNDLFDNKWSEILIKNYY